jgi:hypothetical protein
MLSFHCFIQMLKVNAGSVPFTRVLPLNSASFPRHYIYEGESNESLKFVLPDYLFQIDSVQHCHFPMQSPTVLNEFSSVLCQCLDSS